MESKSLTSFLLLTDFYAALDLKEVDLKFVSCPKKEASKLIGGVERIPRWLAASPPTNQPVYWFEAPSG
jgi:hypothetical protein